MRLILLIPFSFLLLSCSSFNEPRAQLGGSAGAYNLAKVLDEKFVAAQVDPNKETLSAEAKIFAESVKKFGFEGARTRACDKNANSPFCLMSFNNSDIAKKEKSKRAGGGNVRGWLQKEDIASLNQASLGEIISGLKRINKAKAKSISEKALAAETCPSSALLTALGSKSEEEFPEIEWVERGQKLYERSATCSSDESSMRARYRFAMISIWRDECTKAIDHLKAIRGDATMSHLHTRANHWQTHCELKTAAKPKVDLKARAIANLKESPMSFHTLLSFNGSEDEPFITAKARKEPLVQFRTNKDPALNAKIEATEFLMLIEEMDLARRLIGTVRPEILDKTELEFQLYVGTLFHRLNDGLGTFQTLSRVFSLDPNLKTPTGLRLFYPSQFFDVVKEHAGTNDPVLILSLIRQESAFNVRATSRVGARGLMQLMPRTARAFQRVSNNELYQPGVNVKIGNKFFSRLLKKYDGSVGLSLAAYNAGPLQVDEWRRRYPTDNQILFMDMIPFRETREYVAIILRNYYWYTRLYPEFGKGSGAPLTAGLFNKVEDAGIPAN